MNEFWVDRSQEGRALAERLRASSAPITVLYGAAESGKTDFVRDAVMPLIPRASYRDADLGDIPKTSAGETVFIDSFEALLVQTDTTRMRLLAESLRMAGRQSFKLVLMIGQDYLNRLFQLQQDVPRLMEEAIEIPPIRTAQLFDTFLKSADSRDIHLSPAARDELLSDLERCSARAMVDPELFAILAVELKKLQKDAALRKDDYEAAGQLMGILESHVESVLDAASGKFDPQMIWAVLETIDKTPAVGARDFEDVAARFDAAEGAGPPIADWLEKDTALVRKDKLGRRVVRPRQLSAVMEDRRQREVDADEHLTLMLRQGVRHFADTATYLSESSFRKIHARRTTIRANEDEIKLMLRCALAYEDARAPEAAGHWLRRLQNPDDAVEILLDATFDSRPETRQRAAARLHDFNRPEVRRQLHLLALRDPVDAVRSQAIESLDAVKDEALRNALIQEVNDVKSPYRLPALETLRIFKDHETVQALLRVVHDASADQPEARSKAIEVLGRQDEPQPADALLKIALEDENWKNRQDAAAALGLMKSEEPLQGVLDKLRLQRPKAKQGAEPFSFVRALLTPLYVGLAAAVVILTFFVHGLLLATFGRWRLGIAITAIEFAGLALAGSTDNFAGIGIVLLTFAAGLLVPTRIMLAGRLESRSHSRYRRWTDLVLGAVDSVTFFLVFPGLAPLLSGHLKRGLGLIGIGIGGMALVIGSVIFRDEFAAFNDLSRVFKMVPQSMVVLGVLLLAVAYVVGLGFTLMDSFLWPHKKEWKQRLDNVYSNLFSRAPAWRVVVAKLRADGGDETAWAASLVGRYRGLFRQVMEEDPLKFLKTAVRAKGWRVKSEYWFTLWEARLASFPKYWAASGVAGLLALIAFSAVSYELIKNAPPRLMAAIQNPSSSPVKRTDAVRKLGVLAEAGEPFAVESLTTTALNTGLSDEVRKNSRQALKKVAQMRLESQNKLIKSLGQTLNSSKEEREVRQLAIAALQELGIRPAAVELQEFVVHPVPLESRGKPGGRDDSEAQLKFAAITAIQYMSDLGSDGFAILNDIQQNVAVPIDFKEAAKTAIDNFDPAGLAETEYDRGQYAIALVDAAAAIQKLGNDPQAERARSVFARSHLRLGAALPNAADYNDAKYHFDEAMKFKSADMASAAIDLGLHLIGVAHETIALKDPKGYQDTYQIASSLQALEQYSPDSKTSIESNLAEAALTLGKYDEALRITEGLLQQKDLNAEDKLNIEMIAFAARIFKADPPGADKAGRGVINAYNSLPRGFKNGWSYDGTLHYIEASSLRNYQKENLSGLIQKIASK